MIHDPVRQLEQLVRVLQSLRAPLTQGEYDLHQLVADALLRHGIAPIHECRVAPRARIDFFIDGIGLEIKRGKPAPSLLRPQLTRYAASPLIKGILLISEGSVALPDQLLGKPLRTLCLHRLWGIAI